MAKVSREKINAKLAPQSRDVKRFFQARDERVTPLLDSPSGRGFATVNQVWVTLRSSHTVRHFDVAF